MSTATLPAAPARRPYLCKLNPNPAGVFTGTVGPVTLSRFRDRQDYTVTKDAKGVEIRKPTGTMFREHPVVDLSEDEVAAFKARLPFAVLRPGSGILKLDACWKPVDPVTKAPGARYTAPASEGDLPLADWIDFRPWGGATAFEENELAAENARLKAELDALKARLAADDAAEAERVAKQATVLGEREVGPRHKKATPTP